jgi:hypothetical protein
LQFELNDLSGETRQNGSVTISDVTEKHLYDAPIIASGDHANNDTKFTSAASEYFK